MPDLGNVDMAEPNKNKISVVIPLYNKECYIERTIKSVLTQTVLPDEIIVVNDGSTDRSAEVVENVISLNKGMDTGLSNNLSIKPEIRLINQKNAGVSAARNRGIREAKNNLIAFLDSDDEWKPRFLEIALDLVDRYPDAGIYAAAYETIDEKAVVRRVQYRSIPDYPWSGLLPDFFDSMLGQPPVCSSASVVRRQAIEAAGWFREGEVLAEDVDTWCRIALKFPVAFSTETGAVYHLDAVNRCYTRGRIKKASGYIETLEAARADKSIPETVRHSISILREMVELGYASSLIFGHQPGAARKVLKEFDFVHHKKQKWLWYVLSFFPVRLLEFALDFKSKHGK